MWHPHCLPRRGLGRYNSIDSLAWKNFNKLHPSFAQEPQNVRLGLASDGFNPFGNMSISYNIWPVVLIPFN